MIETVFFKKEEGRLLWWENCLNHPATVLAMCQPWRLQTSASRQPTQAAFGAVRSIGMRASIIPAALPARERGGALHTSYLELEHSSGASLA